MRQTNNNHIDLIGNSFKIGLARIEVYGNQKFKVTHYNNTFNTLLDHDQLEVIEDGKNLWSNCQTNNNVSIHELLSCVSSSPKPFELIISNSKPQGSPANYNLQAVPVNTTKDAIVWDIKLELLNTSSELNYDDVTQIKEPSISQMHGVICEMAFNENNVKDVEVIAISGELDGILSIRNNAKSEIIEQFIAICFPDDAKNLGPKFKQKILNRERFTGRFRIYDATKKLQWLAIHAEYRKSELGKIYYFFSIREVTKYIESRIEISQALDLVHMAINGTLDAFYLLQAHFNENQQLTDFIIKTINQPAIEQLGMKKDELVNHGINELFPVNIENGLFDQYKKVYETGEPLNQKYEVPEGYHAAGYYEQCVVKTKTGIGIFNRDVTQRTLLQKEYERQAKELKETLKELELQKLALDQHSIVAITDANGTMQYVNQAFSDLCGYSKDELIGENHRKLNSDYHPKEFFTQMFTTLKSGNVWKGEIRNKSKSGKFYWVYTTIVAIMSENGNAPTKYIAVSTDLSERRQKEQEIIDANNRFKLASEAVKEAIWDWDIVKDELEYTGMVQELFGYSPSVIKRRKKLIQFIHPDDKAGLIRNLNRSLINPSKREWEAQYRLQKADGIYANVQDRGIILRDKNGTAIRMIGALSDHTDSISYQKFIEDQNEKLKEIARLQSHGMRVPIANIMGLMYLVENGIKEISNNEIKDKMLSSVHELDDMVRRVAKLTDTMSSPFIQQSIE